MLEALLFVVLVVGLYLYVRQCIEIARLKKQNRALMMAERTFGKLSATKWFYDRLEAIDKRSGGTFTPARELLGETKAIHAKLASEWTQLEKIEPSIKKFQD